MTKKSTNPIVRFIDKLFEIQESREKVRVSRKKYILISLLLGWCGGHRFYSKRYILGILYLAFCWTGLSIAMTLVDLMIVIPLPVDEEGFIEV